MDCELEDEVASKPETLVEVPDAQDLFTLVRSERGKLDSYLLEPEVNGVNFPTGVGRNLWKAQIDEVQYLVEDLQRRYWGS